MTNTPATHTMTLAELAAWVTTHNNGMFNAGDFPAIDELTDDEVAAAREEYESMADQIAHQ